MYVSPRLMRRIGSDTGTWMWLTSKLKPCWRTVSLAVMKSEIFGHRMTWIPTDTPSNQIMPQFYTWATTTAPRDTSTQAT